MFQNAVTQIRREQVEEVVTDGSQDEAWKGDDANQDVHQELQVMSESSSSVFPDCVKDSSCFSSSSDYKVT
jgi:hypothetical protein